MSQLTEDETAITAISAATVETGNDAGLPPARFNVVIKQEDDPAVAMDKLRSGLSPMEVTVEQVNPKITPRLLSIRIKGRASRNEYSKSYEAAYRLIDVFDLENAEPEIFTDIYVEPDPSREGGANESIDDFPPGCWVGPDDRVKQNKQWALDAMGVRDAWALSPPGQDAGAGIIIAQPDTGITIHGELEGTDYVQGTDVLDDDNDPEDPMNIVLGSNGHGTATASVVISPDGGDVLGSAPNASLMPIRAITNVVRVSQLNVADAINYAVDNGAHVITMSLGGAPSVSLWFALNYAVRNNVIVLAAAGNCVEKVVYPARYEDCLAIAGSNIDNEPWKGSCRGPAVVATAPGENVYRALVERSDGELTFTTGQGQGTSFSVALTAGVTACWLAHHGRDTLIEEAVQRGETLQVMFSRLLRATAVTPNGWNALQYGAGIVNAPGLLQASLDLGAGESAAASVARGQPGDTIRSLAFEATGDPLLLDADLAWDVLGPEIALSIFRRIKGVEPSARAETIAPEAIAHAQRPDLSETLAQRISNMPLLKAAVGR